MTPTAFAASTGALRSPIRASKPLTRQTADDALLESHVQRCGLENTRWSDVRTFGANVHHFFAPRFATTLTLLLVVIVSVSMAV